MYEDVVLHAAADAPDLLHLRAFSPIRAAEVRVRQMQDAQAFGRQPSVCVVHAQGKPLEADTQGLVKGGIGRKPKAETGQRSGAAENLAAGAPVRRCVLHSGGLCLSGHLRSKLASLPATAYCGSSGRYARAT